MIYCEVYEKDHFTISTSHEIGGVLVRGQTLTENSSSMKQQSDSSPGFIRSLFQRLYLLFVQDQFMMSSHDAKFCIVSFKDSQMDHSAASCDWQSSGWLVIVIVFPDELNLRNLPRIEHALLHL